MTTVYSKFLSLNPTFHQICSSVFLSPIFHPRFEASNLSFSLAQIDMRAISSSIFAFAQEMCTVVVKTADEAKKNCLKSTYLSQYLTNEQEFVSRLNVSLENFKKSTPTSVLHLVRLIELTTKGNQLLSGSFSNANFVFNRTISIANIISSNPLMQICNCGISDDSCAITYDDYCINKTNLPSETYTCTNISIPGLSMACYIVDGIFTSTLECLYNPYCLIPV